MNFFGLQDQANRSTRKLIFLFTLAVAGTIVSIYVAIVLLLLPPKSFEGDIGFHFIRLFTRIDLTPQPDRGIAEWLLDRDWWNPVLFFAVAGITTAIVAGGAAFKISQIRRGGGSLASMLGGRPVPSFTSDPDERRLLNVVEEMAIASGTRIPAVYLLEQEPGINAFAAGFSPEDTVIGVTQGSLRLLNRDELQGVVAHEFSHILRGDMRLNMRLMGTVAGITLISTIGYFLLRFSTVGVRFDSSGSRQRARGKGGGGMGAGIIVLGALLFALGYLGVVFSNLIKSAIGRQREYLAGLAGALKKIGGLAQGSRIRSPHAPEISHFFFSNGLGESLLRILSTHPPLVERIRRLDPFFTGEFPRIEAPPVETSPESASVSALAEHPPAVMEKEAGDIRPRNIVANIGDPTEVEIEYAAALRDGLPSSIMESLREPFGASAVVFTLLLSPEEQIRQLQIRQLQQDAPAAVLEEVKKLLPVVSSLGTETRIPLVDLSIQALRSLSDRQYEQFRALMEAAIMADKRIDLFEFCLQRILKRHLDAHFHGVNALPVKHHKTEDVLPESLYLLSALAWMGGREDTAASSAFMAGAQQLNLSRPYDLTMESQSESRDLDRIDRALEQLSMAGLYVKKNVLLSCAHVVACDGRVLEAERELLRAIADSLGLPVPPFVRELMHYRNTLQ